MGIDCLCFILLHRKKEKFFSKGGLWMNRYEQALEDMLWFASQSIGTRTHFVSHIEETFKVIKVFNQNGCSLEEGVELPKDHAI